LKHWLPSLEGAGAGAGVGEGEKSWASEMAKSTKLRIEKEKNLIAFISIIFPGKLKEENW